MSVDYLTPSTGDSGVGPTTVGFNRRGPLDDSPERRARVSKAVARAKAGDREAIRYLYVCYADNVYGYVRSIVHDEHDAEDVTQQVFAKLMTVIGKYEQRAVPFSAWILRVARNIAIDHTRRSRLAPCGEIRGADGLFDDASHERGRDLNEALSTLPNEQRDVLMLRHVVGLSPPEIAKRLGKSEGSIHGLHHRGRRALQGELRRMGLAPAIAAA